MAARDDYVYQAILAEQAERYDEMVESMKRLVGLGQELTVEERNLLSVAYKNLVGVRRGPWRTISTIESREEAEGSAKKAILTEYRKQIEEELINICLDIIDMLDRLLIPASQNGESKVFYFEMKGDYYRYLAGHASENERDDYVEKSLIAFKAASDIAEGIHVRETN